MFFFENKSSGMFALILHDIHIISLTNLSDPKTHPVSISNDGLYANHNEENTPIIRKQFSHNN